MLPGVSQVRPGPGPGHRQGVREPGFSSPLPLASEWSSGSLADEEKATFALGGRRDDWRRARWTGTISELEACWPGWPGGPGPGARGGGGRGYRAMDIGRVSPSGRIEVQEQIDLASSRRRDLDICWTWETAEELLEARWVVGECRNRS